VEVNWIVWHETGNFAEYRRTGVDGVKKIEQKEGRTFEVTYDDDNKEIIFNVIRAESTSGKGDDEIEKHWEKRFNILSIAYRKILAENVEIKAENVSLRRTTSIMEDFIEDMEDKIRMEEK